MPGKVDIYRLGDVGVDVVNSPIHKEDGSLLSAQNAAYRLDRAEGGIGKRPGMTELNTVSTAAGSISAFFVVRLDDPLPGDTD